MRAEIIAVGSELLTPSRLDTNSLFITRKLNELGFRVMRKFVVGDLEEEIRECLSAALSGSEVIVMVGGLGPTHDDITREVVAETLGRQLILDAGLERSLRTRYQAVRLRLGENSLRQAMVPEAAEVIENPNGTAAGLFLQEGHTLLFLLPGPPSELKPMMIQVTELINKHKSTSVSSERRLRVASEAESSVDLKVGPIYKSYPSIQTTILSSPGLIDLHFLWVGEKNVCKAEAQLEELSCRVTEKLSGSVFTDQQEELEEVLGRTLHSKGKSLATAESCTGGLVGKMITDVPGSSEYYRGGVVCYSDDLKINLLGVNETTLERFGAVSQEVAHQMALGVRRVASADLGLSLTGIAGPGGGSQDKPVGLVFIGLSSQEGTQVKKRQFSPPRETIRLRASRFALDWVRRTLV